MKEKKLRIWQSKQVMQALKDSMRKLGPRIMIKNPVMFVVEVVSVITLWITASDFFTGGDFGFNGQVSLWLWFTIFFANFAEALAEGQGRAQAESLKKNRSEAFAKRLLVDGHIETVSALTLRRGDLVMVEDGDPIPGDGEVIEGVALVDESAITGESAPVIRGAGGGRSGVTGGPRVLSGKIKGRKQHNPGDTFLDRMIALVEGAERQKTPNEIALNILLAGLTIIFLLAVATLLPYAIYSVQASNAVGSFVGGAPASIT